LVGIPPFAGFFSKDSILSAALDRGTYGDIIFAAGQIGALLTGLYTFRLFFIVFTGEPTGFAREHLHAHRAEGPLSMRWTVGVLALLSAIGGFLQFGPVWTPLTDWLDPIARPIAEASSGREAFGSALAVGLGVLGIAIAWALYSAKRLPVPRTLSLLQKKFYWDELYDVLLYRAGELVARGFFALVERPLIAGSLAAVTGGMSMGGRELGQAQNGLVRSYVLALAGGLAVLAVVFLSVR
ncbi:MAG: hypothetical protein ACRDM1_12735, partial [Gaiellaceae bacterium]